MVLDVTAKDDKGNKIFSEQKEYVQYGMDVDGDMRYGAWQIKRFADTTLQPLAVKREHMAIPVAEGTKTVDVSITLKYDHPGAKLEIPIYSLKKKVTFTY